MSTYKEIIYLILDELKLSSDDSTFTEEHILYLINNYRSFLLKQRYSDIKKQIPDSNYQEICLDLEEVPTMDNCPCILDAYFMKSTKKIPTLMNNSNTKVYSDIYIQGEIPFINKDRMKYVGYNKFIPTKTYATISSNQYLYLKSFLETIVLVDSIKLYGVFQDALEASKLKCHCDEDTCNISCDPLDNEFPLEISLIPPLVELVVKELSRSIYAPKDEINNANDNLDQVTTKK